MSFLGAAERVLREADKPLRFSEITQIAMESGWLQTEGKTPAATMHSQLAVSVKRRGAGSPFVRVSPATFGLREWVEQGRVAVEDMTAVRSYVPKFPVYANVRAVLPVWVGATPAALTRMQRDINELAGTPENQVDWTDPDVWIDERLLGDSREWARQTWEGSGKHVNPRHITGHWLLATSYGLLDKDDAGRLTITDRGRDFLGGDEGDAVRMIDETQGLTRLLRIIADMGTAARSDLLEPWKEHLLSASRIRADSAVSATLSARLRNLLEREYLEKIGNSYAITPTGLEALDRQHGADDPEPDEDAHLRRLLREQRIRVRESMGELLAEMDPYAFERLIGRLLEAMNYDDVEVTSQSDDKGVDVVANIELGITSVREVVQVKRHQGTISRPTLDQLRGSLHRFGAVRGTIITTGRFSKGTEAAAFEPGAAPITLINGDKLIDLLIENEIGVKTRTLEALELDIDAFSSAATDDDDATGPGDE